MFVFADFVEKLLLFWILTLQPVAVDVTYTVDSLHFINEHRWNIRLHELFSLFLDARSTRKVGHTCSVTPCIYRVLYVQNKGWTNFQGRTPSSRNKFTYRLELLQLYQFWTGVYTCTCSGGIARKSVQSGRVSPKLWDKGHRGSRIAPLGSSDVTDSIVSTSLFERTRATLSSPTRRYLA